MGVLENLSPRKSLHLTEQGLWDKHSPAHCFSKQPGVSHPFLMGSLLILKVALGSGLEIAPTNPPGASVIPSRKQLLPPSFPGAGVSVPWHALDTSWAQFRSGALKW